MHKYHQAADISLLTFDDIVHARQPAVTFNSTTKLEISNGCYKERYQVLDVGIHQRPSSVWNVNVALFMVGLDGFYVEQHFSPSNDTKCNKLSEDRWFFRKIVNVNEFKNSHFFLILKV